MPGGRGILKMRMFPRTITHQNVFRVLIAGFALVMVALAVATVAGLRNIESIQNNAADLIREQSVTNRLIDELQRQQATLREVFSILARDPDVVDYDRIMTQLDEVDRDIDRISAEGAQTPESHLWGRLRDHSREFSSEARRLLTAEDPETFSSSDLFRHHEAFTSVVARLIEAEYRKVSTAQAQIDRRSARLAEDSLVFACIGALLALVFAGVTVRMVSGLIRGMEWQAAELARVSWHMLDTQEDTARRFSHELHDELGGSLTAIKTNLTALDGTPGAGTPRPGVRVEDCLRLVDEAIGNVRQLSQLLRPTILDDFGLEAGLRWLAEGFQSRTGIEVDFHSSFSERLPDETETHLFRIAQEALTNVARHAAAHRVEIRLESRNHEICLGIRDDGCGLPAPANGKKGRTGMGLIGMGARARSAGGQLDIKGAPGQGVAIEVRIPLRHETHSHSAG